MPPWWTWLFCTGWLGNVQRFITRAEPLNDSLIPLFSHVFAAVVVCARSLLLWSIKSHDVDLSVFCLLLYLWFKPRSHWKIPSKQLSSSTLAKDRTICPWKFLEIDGFTLEGALWVIRARFQGNKEAKCTFSSYFRSEFHFREEPFAVSGETPFLYLLAFLSRLS